MPDLELFISTRAPESTQVTCPDIAAATFNRTLVLRVCLICRCILHDLTMIALQVIDEPGTTLKRCSWQVQSRSAAALLFTAGEFTRLRYRRLTVRSGEERRQEWK